MCDAFHYGLVRNKLQMTCASTALLRTWPRASCNQQDDPLRCSRANVLANRPFWRNRTEGQQEIVAAAV